MRSRTSPPTRRHRLLVLDDEAYNVDLVRRTFHRTSTVFTAADLAGAEAILATEPIDLVLADYRLGGAHGDRTGLDAARLIRTRRPEAAIVIVTGFADEPALLAALEQGRIDALVAKPWQPGDLRRRVEMLLARAR